MKPAMSSQGRDHFMCDTMSHASCGPFPQNCNHLFEAIPIVLAQLLESSPQVVEAVLVRREDLFDLVGFQLVERPGSRPVGSRRPVGGTEYWA